MNTATQEKPVYLSGESDIFIGKRSRLRRYLVCSMGGYFPILVKTGPKSLAVLFRTGGTHVSINASLSVSTSGDGGKSWSEPVRIAPGWEDYRNPAMGINSKGELVLAFWKAGPVIYENNEITGPIHIPGRMPADINDKDIPLTFINTIKCNDLTLIETGNYSSGFLLTTVPYGRIITGTDGMLYMSAYGPLRNDVQSGRNSTVLLRSKDDGKTWGDETVIAHGFNETAIAFMNDGTMVAAARSDNGDVQILRSIDNGRTWSDPVQVTRKGEHPADLTVLASGRLLLTFGRRIRPMGCGALLSDDGGKSWNKAGEVLLAGDGFFNIDLGYPSTVQLDNGDIITVLYYANGSDMHEAGSFTGWGYLNCQAIHYTEEDIML